MKAKGFAKQFGDRGGYVCNGDSITCTVDGFDVTARIYPDDSSDRPDQRQDGFWPSLDPKDAGYIGDGKTPAQLTAAKRRAAAVMNAWNRDEWWYVGVAVTVSRRGVRLTGEYDNAVWGIECNYPSGKQYKANRYLLQTANELLSEALDGAEGVLSDLLDAAKAVQA